MGTCARRSQESGEGSVGPCAAILQEQHEEYLPPPSPSPGYSHRLCPWRRLLRAGFHPAAFTGGPAEGAIFFNTKYQRTWTKIREKEAT